MDSTHLLRIKNVSVTEVRLNKSPLAALFRSTVPGVKSLFTFFVLFIFVQQYCYAAMGAGQIDANQTICSGTAPATITSTFPATNTGGLFSYFWRQSTTAAFSGYTNIPATNSATYTSGILTVSTWFKRGATNGLDTVYTDPVKITIANTGNTIGSAQTICSATTPAALTGTTGTFYLWLVSTTSATSGFAPAGGTNTAQNYVPGMLTQNTWYKRVVSNGTCPNDTTPGLMITVTPPTIGGTLAGGGTFCPSPIAAPITLSGHTGNIVKWQSSTSPTFSSGITDIASTVNPLYVLTFNPSTLYYRAIVQNSICAAETSAISPPVIVLPQTVGGTLSGGGAICPGDTSRLLTLNGYTGTILKWQSSTTSNFSANVIDIINTTNTYTAASLSGLTYYRVVVQNGNCLIANSSTTSVLPPPIPGTVSGGNGYCSTTNSTTFTLTGYTGTIVRWESCLTSGFSSAVTQISNSTATLNILNATVTTYYRALVSGGGIACLGAYSSLDSIIIFPPSAGGTISGTDSVCSGSNTTLLTLTGYTGTVLRWESANNAAFTGIVTQLNNTTATYTATNLSATTYFRAVVQSANCPTAYSSTKSIVVVAPSFGGFMTAPSTVCINTNSTVLTTTSYAGTILRWESSTTSNFSTITTIPYTGSSYTVNNISTPMYFRAVVQNGVCPIAYSQVGFINVQVQPNPGSVVGGTNVCITSNSTQLTLVGYQGNIVRWESSNTFDFSGTITTISNTSASYTANNLTATTYYRAVVQYLNCATVNSAVAGIIVDPISVGGTVTGATDSVCQNINSTVLTLTGYTGTIQWQASTTSATSGFGNIFGANTATYTTTNLSAKAYFRAIVTSGACASNTSVVDSILMKPLSVGGTVLGSNDTVCSGTNSTTFTVNGYTGTVQWQSSISSATTGFSNIIGANLPSYIANNLSAKTYFRAVVTSSTCPSSTSTVDSILINTLSLGGIASGNNDSVCTGTNSTTLTLSGYAGTIQWQSSTSSATAGFSNIVGATASTYIATNLSAKTYFRAIVTNGICTSSTSVVDSILMKTLPIGGTVSGSNDSVCTGLNSTTFTLSGYFGTIQWQSSISSATTGFSNIIGATASTYITTNRSVKTYFRAVVTIGVCPASTSTVDSILINPVSVGGIVSGSNDAVCIGINSTTLTLTGYTGTIQWQASTSSANTGFSNITGANASTYIASDLSVKTYFRAIVTSGFCASGTSAVDSVLINMAPVGGIVSGSNDSVCAGTNLTTLALTGHSGIIQWQASTTSATSGFSNIGTNTSTYIATNLSIKTYYRTITSNGVCPSTTSIVDSISMRPQSIGGIVSGSNDKVCSGTNSTTLTLLGYSGTIQWQVSTSTATTGFSNIIGANTSTYIATNLSVKTYFRAIVTNDICPISTSVVDSVLIYPFPVGGILSGGGKVCTGTNSTTLTLSIETGVVTNWQWCSSKDFITGINNIVDSNKTYTEINLTGSRYYRAVIESPFCTNYPSSYSVIDSIIVSSPSVGGTLSGGSSTVCIGTNSTPLTLNAYSGSILRWESSPVSTFSSGVVSIANTSNTYTATNLSSTKYYRAVIQNGACPIAFSTVDSVVIIKTVGGTLSDNVGICPVCPTLNTRTLTLTGYSGAILKWQSSPKYDFSSSITDIVNTTNTYTAANLLATTFYRAIVQNAGCSIQNSSIAVVSVNPIVKPGKLQGGARYCLTTNNTTLTLTGLEGGIVRWESCLNVNFSSDITEIASKKTSLNIVNQNVTTYYRVLVANSDICPKMYSTIDSIVIPPIAVGGIVSGNKDSICTGTNSSTFTLSGYAGAIQWQSSISSATTGFSNISGAITPTYIATNLSAKTYFRALVKRSNFCPPDTSTVDSVLMNSISVGGFVLGSSDTVCIDTNSTAFTLTGNTGTIQWQASTISATSGFNNIDGATSQTYTASNLSTKTYYRTIVTSGVCPSTISAVDSVFVNPVSVGGIISGEHDNVCEGTNSTILMLTGSTGTIQWQSSTSSATSGFSIINGAKDSAYVATNLLVKTYYRTIVTSGVCSPKTSAVDSILISPVSLGGIVSGKADTVCNNNSTVFTLTGYIGSIQWQSSANSATGGYNDIGGANDSTYTASNLSEKTYYRAIVTSGVCPSFISAIDSVTVNPTSVGGIVSGEKDSVCIGNSTPFKLIGYTGTIQWQASTTSSSSGFVNINGAIDSIYTANNLLTKTYFRAIVTSGVCPPDTSGVDSVLISALSVGGIIAGSNDTVCTDINSTIFTLTDYTGSIQWQASRSTDDSDFDNIPGANDSVYTASNLFEKMYYRAIVTSGVCPLSISAIDSVTVNPASVGGIVSGANNSVCIGINSTSFKLTGSTGNIQWQTSTSSATSGFSNIMGATSSTHTATNLSIKTYFRAIVTSGLCASDTSSVDSILINPLSIGGIASGNKDTVCAVNSTIFTIAGYTGDIQWQSSTSSATSGFSNISGANNSTYTANNLSAKTYFRAIVTSGACPISASKVDSVLVNTTLLNNTISGNMRLCYGSDAGVLTGSIPTGGNGSTYSYAWLSSTTDPQTGFAPAVGINNTKNYAPGKLTQHTWFKRIVFSAPCSADTSNALMDTVSVDIAYMVLPESVSIVYGTPFTFPSIFVKYVDSTSEMRPAIVDTSEFNANIGTYYYPITVLLAPGTCNTKNLTGLFTVTIIPRIIVVKADIKIKEEGTLDPPLTYSIISGVLIGSDTFSGALSRIPGEDVGRYPILQNTLSLSANYSLIYMQDSLTITINLMELEVSKTTPTPFVFCGDSVSYTIRVTNYGPDSLQTGQALTIFDQPAQGLSILDYFSQNGAYNSNTGDLVLNNSFLPGDYIELTVLAKIDLDYPKDSIGNFVLVQPPNYILNTGESRDSAYVSTSRRVDLSIYKIADRDTAQASDTIMYTIIVKNEGPSKLYKNEKIFIQEYLPDSLTDITYTTARPLGSSYDQGSTIFTLGDSLSSGDSVIVNLTGIILKEYTQASITNHVKVKAPSNVFDSDTTNDSSWLILPIKQHALPDNLIVSDQIACKGNASSIGLNSTGIFNPVYTWYADSMLTMPLHQATILDTTLLSTTSFFITVKGDNKLENIPGRAKKVTIHIHDYASDTLILTHDTMVCYNKSAILIAQPKGIITDPVFTWYAYPSLSTPIATGDTFYTDLLVQDTLYYVTIKGSSLCESRELHIVKVTINKDCGNMNIGLTKALSKVTEASDGSYDLTFNFVTKNFGDEPLIDVKLKDDLKPVFPTATVKVVSLSTPGNWHINTNYDGTNDIELLDIGGRFDVGDRQTIQLVINLQFPPDDTTTLFKNVAEISGFSIANGKPIARKSKDGIEPDPDSTTIDTSFAPTPIILKKIKKPKTEEAGSFFIPEGFSPNGDQVNDYFVIENPEKFTVYVAIYNRWGNMLYENSNYDNSWDGKAQKGISIGEGVPDGTYFYIVEYTDASGRKNKLAHSLTIVR